MNLSKFDPILNQYIAAVNPTATQSATIDSALTSILEVMLTAFPDAEGYAQGSYATDTLVKPLTAHQSSNNEAGEYDIDIVIERPEWPSAVGALEQIAKVMKNDPRYGKMPINESKNSCVRVDYADDDTGVKFHVDLVPTLNTNGAKTVADRAEKSWKPSDAKAFAETFNEQADRLPVLRSLAIILKRLRDRNDLTDDIKSILILTMIMDVYVKQDNLMSDLTAIVDAIADKLGEAGTTPVIDNPVNDGENLADTIKDLPAVRAFFKQLNDDLAAALSEDDGEALKTIFGPGFNYTAEKSRNSARTATVAAIVQPTRAYGGDDSASAH